MNLASGIVVFVIVWWCIFFMVLPWGNRAPDRAETGHADSAPERPRLWLKAGVTTVIAIVLFLAIHYAVEANLFSFRDMVTTR